MRLFTVLPASLLLCFLALPAVQAQSTDPLTLTFALPNQTVGPGGTLSFFGTLSNPTSSTVFLNSGTPTLSAPLSITTDNSPFDNSPFSLAPAGFDGNAYTGDFFNVDVGPLTQPGTYFGIYTIQGGADGNASGEVASAKFSVTVPADGMPVPEASTNISLGVLLALGGAGLWRVKRRIVSAAD